MPQENHIQEASRMLGINGPAKLIRKQGRLKTVAVANADEVVGFDYIMHHAQGCYEFYAANPPLIGITQPEPISCPLGLVAFESYKIDYKSAIQRFHEGDWGGKFTSIVLSEPLTPETHEPYWYFRSNLGVQVMIGANTGQIHTSEK